MPRKTKRTIRKLPALTRELVKAANDLDRLSRRLHALSARVALAEHDATALGRFMTSFKSEGEPKQ